VCKPGNYRIYLRCGNVTFASALPSMFRCLQRCGRRQSHQNGQCSCYVSWKMSFHVVVVAEEALLRHAKARDAIHCLGVYPETKPPGSRKRVVCYSISLCNVSRVIGVERHKRSRQQDLSSYQGSPVPSPLPSKLDNASVRLRLVALGLLHRC
jgi:hypothetical protein